MESTSHIETSIHLCMTDHLGVIGMQCTTKCVYVYYYDECNLTEVKWIDIRQIRFKRYAREVKLTIALMGNDGMDKVLRLKVDKPQRLMDQMVTLGRLVKINKMIPSLFNIYYKPQVFVSIGPKHPNQQIITKLDFEDHREICKIAHEFPFKAEQQVSPPAITTGDRVARFFDSMF